MKRRNGAWKKCCAALLALVLMLGNLSGAVPVGAVTPVYGGMGTKVADDATVNNWKAYMGSPDTSLAGGVWTDKSVFETAEAYFEATDEEEDFSISLSDPRNFLLSASAMASTKTIVGYSTLPTDTMFVLDVSGSMDSGSRDINMVNAANKAIGDLLALNNYNRVGVVLYSDSATLLMPLDRYTTTSTTTYNNQTIPSYIRLNNSDQVVASNGLLNSNNRRPNGNREVVGGTYIQDGIYTAMEQLTASGLQTVITEGFQMGTTRTPIMVLMSDGAPTYASTAYNNVANYTFGNGTTSNTTAGMGFATQLTASYAKEKIGQKYGDEVEPLFYTLGLGVGGDAIALSVMDPNNSGASATVNRYWTNFNDLAEGDRMNLDNNNNRRITKLNDGRNDGTDNMPLSKDYVDEYFSAGTAEALSQAFESIVDTIILQTMYYPTLVEDGDVHHSGNLEFTDYIGPNMEVKAVKGVQLGETLYTGERLAHLIATGMGTIENPTDAGNELVWSVITRLKMGQIGDPAATQKARDLIENAWNAGQLAYNVGYDGDVTWNNQICWYADADGKYLGFWDGEGIDEEMKGVAAYAIRSYGFLGDVGEGMRDTDMLYATFQVRTALDANGEVIEDVVYGRLPASLIPVVEYNVELDSNDPSTARRITLTVEGAESPIRFLYEVGLRSEIDLLDMEGTAVEDLKRDEDGNFIFYTNQWDDAGLEEGQRPDKFHNTYVTFEPSEENERYSYHEDMPIYVLRGNSYVLYTGAKPAAGDGNTYYRAYTIYTAEESGGRATYRVEYQQIPDQALAAENVAEGYDRGWLVKKGTIHLYEARGRVDKATNQTGTLPNVEYPVVHADSPTGYHLDAILGNNGLLTINAPEGLKLTKKIDDTLTDNGQTYEFTVELTGGSHEDATIYLVTETDGVRSAWQKIDFADTYTVGLAAGDSAWLAGLPVGNEYTVTETIDGEYEVSAITIDGDETDEAIVTVEEDHMTAVEFTNSAVFSGDITISKNVVSDYAPHMTDDYGFTYEVALTDADPETTYETRNIQGGSMTAGDDIITDANGEATVEITLSHGQAFRILELPEGASVTAVETQLPGFTSDQTDDTASADVVVGENTDIAFVNTYAPEPVSPYGKVDVYVQKILGRDWAEGDSFTFVLEKIVGRDDHESIEEVDVTFDDDDKIADFQSNADELFEEVGTYSYRITEEVGDLPGVAYDSAVCYFDIVVGDDGEGHLYIADVIGRQDVTVIKDDSDGSWAVTADFINTYNAEGAIQATLSVVKDVEDDANTGISKAGFIFELYDADEDFDTVGEPRATVETNAEGVAAFRDTMFTEEGSYYFVLKEAEGDVPGMHYDTTVYHATVEVTSDPATSGLVATAIMVDADTGETVYEGEAEYIPDEEGTTAVIPVMSYAAEFTNSYEPEDTEVIISGTKNLVGRDINDGEFTFELYEASYSYGRFTTGDYITEVTNEGETFLFEDLDELTYTETGYYYYAVKEADGELGGVTYDSKTLYVTVHVTADLEDGALTVNSVNVTDASGANKALSFSNTYRAAATDAVIEGTKEMTGSRKLAANMFQFYLYETDSSYAVSGDPIQTVRNDGSGNVAFDLDYNTVGEHYYVVAERIPTSLDDRGRLNGVQYDETTYRVKVTVTDDLEGSLVAEVSYLDGAPAFVNDYTPAPTTANITGGKVLSGQFQKAGDFSFALYETDLRFVPLDNVADATATTYEAADGSFDFDFGPLTYTQAGGYRYIVVEQNTGDHQVDYDETIYYVLVNVTDNGSGKLVAATTVGTSIDSNAAISVTTPAIEFFNVFNHSAAELVLSGKKTLSGHEWSHEETEHTFTFELYSANEEYVIVEGSAPMTASNDPAAEGSEGDFSFEKLTFEEEGDYYYVVREKLPAGVTADEPRDDSTGIIYDLKEHHIHVTVAVDPEDSTALKATYTVDGVEAPITFTNTYTTEGSVIATISGKKLLQGRPLHADGFSFVLKEDAKELETVSNTGDGVSNEGTFSFAPLTFDEAGTYTYTVEEVKGDTAGVTYSEEVYTVTIKVEDKDGKLLTPVVTYKKGLVSADEMVFTNTYKAGASDKLTLSGTKTLKGGVLGDDRFTFELYTATLDADGAFVRGSKLDETTNSGTAFTFEGEAYEATGEYYYIITEQAGSETGVTYDDNEFYITVVVEDDGSGKLKAHVDQIARKKETVASGVNFTNIFTPEPIDVALGGTKTLNGRSLVDGEFTFELYETGADHIVAEGALPADTAVNTGKTFSFDEITLDKVGSYYYVIKEQKGTLAHVTYDSTVYLVTVEVDNNNGVLEETITYRVGSEEKTTAAFVNNYKKPDPQPDPIEIELEVEKILKGSGYRKGLEDFKFELVDEDDKVIDTARTDDDGEATLTVGTFRKSDAGKTYTYYVYEVDTDIPGMTYSNREYEVEITIYYDSSRNKLTYELVKDGDVVDEDEPFVFTNIYNPGGGPGPKDPYVPDDPYRPSSPKTGDEGVGLWITMLILGSFGFAATAIALFKRRRA